MRKNLYKILLVTLIATSTVLYGCGAKNNDVNANSNKTVAESKEVSKATYPVTVKNYDGNDLVVKEEPSKIASLTLGMDEMLLEMVEDDKVVGLSGKNADDKAVSNVADKATKFSKIENNIEVLLAEKPDLVIGSSWIKKEFLEQLKENNITYYGYKTPETIEKQKEIIMDLSKIVGNEEKGKEIVKDIDTRLEKVQKTIKDSKFKDVKVMAYNMHGSSNGKNTIFDDIVKNIDAVNVSSEAGIEGVAKISKEKIIELNPEVLVLMAWEKDDLKEFEAFAEDLKNDKSLENVDAIKNGRVYIASNRYMTSVSQHIIEGVEFMAESIYKDVYKK